MPHDIEIRQPQRPRHMAGAVIFALVLLFNPNVNLIDILPDFIAYFILYRVFELAADVAPHFAEARQGFFRLMLINLGKLPAAVVIAVVRQSNTMDNDIVALFSLCFLVLELIFIIPTVKHIFNALFYLGERTGAESLIKNDSLVSTDALRSLTYVFCVLKCALYALPEFLRLTQNVDYGGQNTAISGSRYYPWAVLASVVIGTVFGIVWLVRTVRYVKRIKAEGKFFDALISLISKDRAPEYRRMLKMRRVSVAYMLLVISAFLSFDLIFENYKSINLLPPFVFGVLLFAATVRLMHCTEIGVGLKRTLYISGIASILFSAATYVMTLIFIETHGYSALLDPKNVEAQSSYIIVEYLAIAETLLTFIMLACFFKVMRTYTGEQLGIPRTSEAFRKTDVRYHREVNARTLAFVIMSAILRLLKLLSVFSNGDMQLIFSNPSDVTMPTIEASSMPWLQTVITLLNIVLIIYTIYYVNYLKEEQRITLEMRDAEQEAQLRRDEAASRTKDARSRHSESLDYDPGELGDKEI